MKKNLELKIEEYTSFDAETCSPDTSISLIKQTMTQNRFRHMPVVLENNVVGMVSERDIHLVEQLNVQQPLRAEDVMAKEPYVVSAETPIEQVALEMSEQKIGSAIVFSKDMSKLGVFTSTDALNALVEIVRGDVNT